MQGLIQRLSRGSRLVKQHLEARRVHLQKVAPYRCRFAVHVAGRVGTPRRQPIDLALRKASLTKIRNRIWESIISDGVEPYPVNEIVASAACRNELQKPALRIIQLGR